MTRDRRPRRRSRSGRSMSGRSVTWTIPEEDRLHQDEQDRSGDGAERPRGGQPARRSERETCPIDTTRRQAAKKMTRPTRAAALACACRAAASASSGRRSCSESDPASRLRRTYSGRSRSSRPDRSPASRPGRTAVSDRASTACPCASTSSCAARGGSLERSRSPRRQAAAASACSWYRGRATGPGPRSPRMAVLLLLPGELPDRGAVEVGGDAVGLRRPPGHDRDEDRDDRGDDGHPDRRPEVVARSCRTVGVRCRTVGVRPPGPPGPLGRWEVQVRVGPRGAPRSRVMGPVPISAREYPACAPGG